MIQNTHKIFFYCFIFLSLSFVGCKKNEQNTLIKSAPNIFEKGEAFIRGNDTVYYKTDKIKDNQTKDDSLSNYIASKIQFGYMKKSFPNGYVPKEKILELSYILNKHGCIDTSSIHVIRGVDSLTNKFAMQAIKNYHHFQPEKTNSKAVYSKHNIAVIITPSMCNTIKISPPKLIKRTNSNPDPLSCPDRMRMPKEEPYPEMPALPSMNVRNPLDTVSDESKRLFHVVEIMPQFPGDDVSNTELLNYVASHTHYPPKAIKNGIAGRVIVQFIVSNTGKITHPQIIKGIDPECDKEAIRVVSSMPNWIPGKQNGKAVHVYQTVPIVFKHYDQ